MHRPTFTDQELTELLRESVEIVDEVFPYGTQLDEFRPIAFGKVFDHLADRAVEEKHVARLPLSGSKRRVVDSPQA